MSATGSFRRPGSSRLWYECCRLPVQLAAVLGWQVRHWGRENIPAEGGVLVVSNHQSHFDPPLVGMGCPRRMNFLARQTLFRFPPLRWLIRSLDAIPIDREGLGMAGVKASLRRLKQGEMVLVFPEGTRTPDGRLGPFRPGFATLAVRAGVGVLPVAIEGAYQAWPRWRALPRPGRIHVAYAPPISPDQVRQWGERRVLAEVERRIQAEMNTMNAISGEP